MLPTRSTQWPADEDLLTWRDNGISTKKRIAVIVHTDESAWDPTAGKPREHGWSARRLAEYNREAPNDRNRGSYHLGIGEDGRVVRQNDDIYGTWSVGNLGNDNCLHFCLAGTTANFSRDQWLKRLPQLQKLAEVTAHAGLRYGLELRRITPDDLRAGRTGIGGHWDCTKAWSGGSGHWDPGGYVDTAGGFPWDLLVQMVQKEAKNANIQPIKEENVVLGRIRSLINPSKTFSAEETLALLDGSV